MILNISKGDKSDEKVLLGDEILLKIENLPPNKEATIHARRYDDKGQLWYSYATYISDEKGIIKTNENAAKSGSFTGIDPSGLFWSMQIIEVQQLPKILEDKKVKKTDKIFLCFDVEVEGEIVTSNNLETLKMLPEVVKEEVEYENLVANFYYPNNKTRLTPVIVVSGSEGGITTPDIVAGILASKGYAAMALAYFAMPGLPKILEEIPLEYIETAINWILNQKNVNEDKLAMMGTSKGAELTLLSASIFSQIKMVIASSPSVSVSQAIDPDPNTSPKSSWTYKDKPLPFVPFVYTEEFLNQFSKGYPKRMEFLSLYKASFQNQEEFKHAIIQVENINGPILLISGGDDKVWPSKELSGKIIERLKAKKFPFKIKHLNFEGAGHVVARPGYMPWPAPFYLKGGKPEINGKSQVKIWKSILNFLERL